jgi:tetratricopeptide (TPR) repeat protein
VDNLETIDDDTVLAFIRDLPAPAKAIVTTRHRIDVAYPIRLRGMDWQDAAQLIQEASGSRDILLTSNQIERLYQRTGGVPLAIMWSIGLMSAGYPIETVLDKLGEPSSDIIRFCFEQSFDSIRSTPAEKLLIALSYFATSASRDALGSISALSTLDRDDGLVVLEKLSLVNKQNDRFYLLPITRVFAITLSKRDMGKHLEYGKRWMQYLQSLHSSVEEYAAEFRLKFGTYMSPDDGPNLLEAVAWAYEFGSAYDVFSMTVLANDYLDTVGRWAIMQDYQMRALDLARTVQNQRALARLLHSAGWLHEQRGEYEQAKQHYLESMQYFKSDNNLESLVIVLQRYSGVFRKQKDFAAAREIIDDAWEIAVNLNSGDLNALLYTEEGKHQRDLGNWDASWRYFSQVRDYFEKRIEESPRDEQLATGTYGHLALIAYYQGRPQESKELCLRSIDFFAKYGTKGYLATLKYRLALAEEALGEFDAARLHVGEAIHWFTTLGMTPDLPQAEALRNRLQQAQI